MRIVAATPAHRPGLVRLMTTSTLLRRYGVTAVSARASLREARRAGDTLFVAIEGGEVIGLAWVIVTRALDRSAYLRLLLVADGARSRGIGAALLDRAERAAVRSRCRHLALLVTRTNRKARAFYERQGYRHAGDLPGFVQPGITEALYLKRVSRA